MNCTSILLLSMSALFFFSSCKKQAPPCTGNCGVINANGQVINKVTSTAAPGVPVSLSWTKFVGGFSYSEVIATVTSLADGSFNFTANADTTYFNKGYFLSLSVGANNEYMILGYSGTIETRTYSFNPNAFQGVHFGVYKQANLRIRLHRSQNDYFQAFSISHSNVVNDFFLYDYNVQSPQEVIDANKYELNVKTVADVYTKIKVVKTFSAASSITTIDSVRCNSNSTTLYDINF